MQHHLYTCVLVRFRKYGLVALLFVQGLLYAQEKDTISVPIIARAQVGKVLLRWATDNALAWQRSNVHGYTLERFTVYRDGKRLERPESKILSTTSLKPLPLEQWERLVQENDNAAIMAQAIYGDDFEVGTQEGELLNIVNKARVLEQRFSFALFAADTDFEVARFAGLGFEDTSVRSNEGYLYRVRSNIPEEQMHIAEGTVYIEASDTEPLPKPIDLVGVFKDRSVLLTWDYERLKSQYTTYHVERSEDGAHFERLGNAPLLTLNNNPKTPANRMYYVDTIPQNNKTYHYRVLGRSPFGEEGRASDTISGKGRKGLSSSPFITGHTLVGESSATVAWEFPISAEDEITEFQIRASATENGSYNILKKGIAPPLRQVVLDQLSATTYLKVVAMGKDSTETQSFSALVQLIDSIPPAIPKGLSGVIDSTGIATLSWKANTEKDLLGYRIFRANLETEEYVQLTRSPINTTTFKDTVAIKSLNDKVYYTLVAVDQRFNNSDYSEALALKKPDIVPPSPPVFKDFKVTDEGVSLSWIPSTSTDVGSHQLLRKTTNSVEGWEVLWETPDTLTTYTDKKAAPNTTYSYSIQAVDDSGLISMPSPNITVQTAAKSDTKVLKGLNFEIDRTQNSITLYWRKLPEQIQEVLIYKSKKEGQPVLFKQLPSTITQLRDQNISPSNVYRYQLRPVFTNGSYGQLEVLDINY